MRVLSCICLCIAYISIAKSIFNTQMNFTTFIVLVLSFHFRYPSQFFSEISMRGDQFWPCLNALIFTVLVLRLGAYILLRWKVIAVR